MRSVCLCKEPQTLHAPGRRRFIKISIRTPLRRFISNIKSGVNVGRKGKRSAAAPASALREFMKLSGHKSRPIHRDRRGMPNRLGCQMELAFRFGAAYGHRLEV